MKKTSIKKRKLNRKYILILVILFLGLSVFLLQKRSTITFIEKSIRDIFLTPLNLVGMVDRNNSISNQSDDNTTLRLENIELKKEIDELKNIVNLNNLLSDKVIVTANVIKRDMTSFYDTITINKGNNSGIIEGQAVISGNGLIGKTKNVSNYYSDVELLTSVNINKISVKIKSGDDFVYGLLSGYNKDKNIYYIEGISNSTDVFIDSDVTTTGMGDIFPSGILIGKVINITTDHFDLSKIIEVTPSVNPNDFTVVSVLKRNVSQ